MTVSSRIVGAEMPVMDQLGWAVWLAHATTSRVQDLPELVADTPAGQDIVRQAMLGARDVVQTAGTIQALMLWVPDRATGAVEAVGVVSTIGWAAGTRPTRDQYLVDAQHREPTKGVTILGSSVFPRDVETGPVAYEVMATQSTSRRWGRSTELPPILQYRATVFPPDCDDALLLHIVLDDEALSDGCERGFYTFVHNVGISVGPVEWQG